MYQAAVIKNANKVTKNYLGLAETSFKTQFLNHNKYLNHEQYKKHRIVKIYIVVKKGSNNV